MNQGFKLRFDQLRAGDPTKTHSELDKAVESYADESATRNLGFVWPDGRRMFVNYAYLVSGTFDGAGNQNRIILSFSAYDIVLQGYGLEPLFTALFDHLPRLINVLEPRYAATVETGEPAVIAIELIAK